MHVLTYYTLRHPKQMHRRLQQGMNQHFRTYVQRAGRLNCQLNDFDVSVQSWRLRLQRFGSLVPPRAAAVLVHHGHDHKRQRQRQRQVNLTPKEKDAVSLHVDRTRVSVRKAMSVHTVL
jgi:hypothetical protein